MIWRTDVVRLEPTPEQEKVLREVGDAMARLVNMENYRRRRLFFEGKGIDCSWMSAWKQRKEEYKEVYELLDSANFHEASRFISEAWKSFRELLRAKKEGRLTLWQNPPGYMKKERHRTPIIVIRCDQYKVDLEKKKLHICLGVQRHRVKLSVPFKGKPKWLLRKGAKKGRLVVKYDIVKQRWYAHMSVLIARVKEVEKPARLIAGIDLGREVLVTAVTEHGEGLLYRGGPLKSAYYYFERRIATLDRMIAKTEETDKAVLREERRRLYEKRKKQRDQIFANTSRHLAEEFKKHGVGIVFIGYPKDIAQEKPGKENVNMWSYRKLVQRLSLTLENYNIAVFAVDEHLSSKKCAWHDCEAKREPRGLIKCPKGHTQCTAT